MSSLCRLCSTGVTALVPAPVKGNVEAEGVGRLPGPIEIKGSWSGLILKSGGDDDDDDDDDDDGR